MATSSTICTSRLVPAPRMVAVRPFSASRNVQRAIVRCQAEEVCTTVLLVHFLHFKIFTRPIYYSYLIQSYYVFLHCSPLLVGPLRLNLLPNPPMHAPLAGSLVLKCPLAVMVAAALLEVLAQFQALSGGPLRHLGHVERRVKGELRISVKVRY